MVTAPPRAYDKPNREELQVPAWMSAKTYETARTCSNKESMTVGAQGLCGGLRNRHPKGLGGLCTLSLP